MTSLSESEFKSGSFKPSWESLSNYKCPEWFRDAKFGIWAHWGPQCQPGQGDWYARQMYSQGHEQYEFHCKHYGHPSKAGFKEVINDWQADKWDPAYLLSRYKHAGAKYVVGMANHHDNLDLFDSSHHAWNTMNVGPKRDIIRAWRDAILAAGLRFGVSTHSSHAWSWYEVAQSSDLTGPLANVPYDGKLTKADGVGTWWEGLDPQELYAQNHAPLNGYRDLPFLWDQARWAWTNGVSVPDEAYIDKFARRTLELIDKYEPDLLCFDDTIMPLYPISGIGVKLASHLYNSSIARHGSLEAVFNTKCLVNDQQKSSVVWDIERGGSPCMLPLPWQTETCIGQWHYSDSVFEKHEYKSVATVLRTLIDAVSKNGNLLLSVPMKGDGTIDSDEEAILDGIGEWMSINGEAIYGTRPWVSYGEGPIADSEKLITEFANFTEGTAKTYTSEEIRFTTKGDRLYALVHAWPGSGDLLIKSLGSGSAIKIGNIRSVQLLGYGGDLKWRNTDHGLVVTLPDRPVGSHIWTLKLEGAVM